MGVWGLRVGGGPRLWAAARAEAEGKMWSVRALVESAVEQGRRVLQHAQKRQVTLVPRQQTRAPDARHKLNKVGPCTICCVIKTKQYVINDCGIYF